MFKNQNYFFFLHGNEKNVIICENKDSNDPQEDEEENRDENKDGKKKNFSFEKAKIIFFLIKKSKENEEPESTKNNGKEVPKNKGMQKINPK